MEEPRTGHCGENCYKCGIVPYIVKGKPNGANEEWCYCNFMQHYEGYGEQPFRKLVSGSQVFKPRNIGGKGQSRVYVVPFREESDEQSEEVIK